MNLNPKHAMQAGGMCHLWQSPDRNFRHLFLRVEFDCEPDNHPGIVILADEYCENAFAAGVQNLQKELPALLQKVKVKPVAYWWLEGNPDELKRILTGLTEHPVFADTR